ncbi:DgyrCDS8943 [Dimorphilus gyrociliatus]|uniref:Conserved oligomeric Golgi complex subunit 5 n=1 Tax=Dimorphilus gyrociliatus TaxID=2664684 RepID=A0A7I8VVL3_9ANNE|nr:DgyrCDS8943 [Dimorphilus gyrociliatus]
MQGMSIANQLKKISDGLDLLDKELHNQIVTHHEDLLSQATGVETLEGVLQIMQNRIESLMTSLERIKARVTEPYEKIVKRTKQLKRLQEACDLLRRIIRLLYLSKRLKIQLEGGAREIAKSAQSLAELDYLMEGQDLSGIDIIEQDRRFIRQARKEVETHAQSMLAQGIENKNQSSVSTALQVFYHLDMLKTIVNQSVLNCIKCLKDHIGQCVNVQHLMSSMKQTAPAAPGRSALPTNTAAFRAALWTNMEKVMDSIYNSCAQMQHLNKVIAKKKDPVSHTKFSDILENDILDEFWSSTSYSLTTVFSAAVEENTYVKQALEGEYPKLIRLFNDLWRRLGHLFEDETVEDTQRYENQLRNSISLLEEAYLSKSLSRLFDVVNMALSSGNSNPPSINDIEAILKVFVSELNFAKVDSDLMYSVASNVSKTLNLFAVKCEQISSTDGEASQVISPPTQGQTRNAQIVNVLYRLFDGGSKIIDSLENVEDRVVNNLKSSLNSLTNCMKQTICPLFTSISEALEAIIATLHNEDFSSSDHSDGSNCSLYMKELGDFIQRVDQSYLVQFDCRSDWLDEECVLPLASRCIQLFIRHVCLTRPVGEGGRLRLAADCAELERAVQPLCKPSFLGSTYKSLRALRPLLFMTPENLITAPSLGEAIPYSFAIHLLLARAPSSIPSPYSLNNWSMNKYSDWLNKHSEKERLALLQVALQTYVSNVQKRGEKEYDVIYPFLFQLLQDAQATFCSNNGRENSILAKIKFDAVNSEGIKFTYSALSPIIFIGGVPRSGTTLMRVILDAHPNIRCGEETRIIPRILNIFGPLKTFSFEDLKNVYNIGLTGNILERAVTTFILEIIVRHGEPSANLCNKDPFTLKSSVYLSNLFPNSKFILMVRDGRAVVHSLINRYITVSGFNLSDYSQCLSAWNSIIKSMITQCEDIGSGRCLIVRYENLILQQESTLRKVMEFLQVEWSENTLNHEKFVGKKRGISLSKVERSSSQVIQPVNLNALYNWTKDFPKDLQKRGKLIAPMLQTLGYKPDHFPPFYGKPNDNVIVKTREIHLEANYWKKLADSYIK